MNEKRMTKHTATYIGEYDEVETRGFWGYDTHDAWRQAIAWLYLMKEDWPEWSWELVKIELLSTK